MATVSVSRVNQLTGGICVTGIQQFGDKGKRRAPPTTHVYILFITPSVANRFEWFLSIQLWLTAWFVSPLRSKFRFHYYYSERKRKDALRRICSTAVQAEESLGGGIPRGDIVVGWKRVAPTNARTARLQLLARRTLIGSLVTMSTTATNLIVVMIRNGVSAWLCLILCKLDSKSSSSTRRTLKGKRKKRNVDGRMYARITTIGRFRLMSSIIVFVCAVVLHWVTKTDSLGSISRRQSAPWRPARDTSE